MMEDQRFAEPVRVALGRLGRTVYVVERVALAFEILLNAWPAPAGPKHAAALKVCAAVMEGRKEARLARRAFINAAVEAGILVQQDAEWDPRRAAGPPRDARNKSSALGPA